MIKKLTWWRVILAVTLGHLSYGMWEFKQWHVRHFIFDRHTCVQVKEFPFSERYVKA